MRDILYETDYISRIDEDGCIVHSLEDRAGAGGAVCTFHRDYLHAVISLLSLRFCAETCVILLRTALTCIDTRSTLHLAQATTVNQLRLT